jgi:hypothetical protein
MSVCNGNYGNTGWLGIAEISIASGGTITRGKNNMNLTKNLDVNISNPSSLLS